MGSDFQGSSSSSTPCKIKALKEIDRYVTLMFDEVHLTEDIEYDNTCGHIKDHPELSNDRLLGPHKKCQVCSKNQLGLLAFYQPRSG